MRVEELVDLGDDVVFANARTQHFVHHVVGAVDHGGGAVEQRDLIGRFHLARAQHHLLAVLDLEPDLFQFEDHRRLDDVDADRHLGDAGGFQDRRHLLGVPLHQPEGRIDGAAQADQASPAILRLEPGRIELVVHRGRAEVPQDRVLPAHQQRPARELVARPFADLGRGDVTDIVVVEQQQRAEIGFFERGLRAAPGDSGAGAGSRRAPRSRRPWCRAPAGGRPGLG